MGGKFIFLAIFLLQAFFLPVNGEPGGDKQALLDFMQEVSYSRPLKSLNWNKSTSACRNWTGVTCNHGKSRVIALRLPGFGFQGLLPSNTLGQLSALEILNLTSNGMSGPFPSDFSRLGKLTSLHLQFNDFSGPLPVDFSVWSHLSVINLSNNGFNGSIPSSIASLTHLTALNLANNSLSGEIPDLDLPNLQVLDLSNNNLTGTIPQSLQRFPREAFLGNNLLTGNSAAPPLPRNEQPGKKSSNLSEAAILGIAIGGCALGLVALAVLVMVCYSKKDGEDGISAKSGKRSGSVGKAVSGGGSGRLVFFEGCNLAFDLEDLLRASAEVLGKGTFGTTYKAALEDATTVVVKRLKEASMAKRDFEQHMEVVGSIRHDNVAALRAYYYNKDEKLMVYDYYSQGSVSAMLHDPNVVAKRGECRIPVDWETRLRIAIGAARGMAHIHTQNGGRLIHGNIKASNIFLNSQGYGCVSELGLATLMSPTTSPVTRNAGHKAPEVTDIRKASQASDVYSFGVLLLELLTGKSPVYSTRGDEVVHLVRWVHSVVREEWTAEVFDIELLRYPNIEEEMVEMLQIGLACAARMPEERPKTPDVLRRIEDIRRIGAGNRLSPENRSEDSTPARTPAMAEEGSPPVPVP